ALGRATTAGTSARCAMASAPASGLSLTTSVTRAATRPEWQARSRCCRFEPRPEHSTATRSTVPSTSRRFFRPTERSMLLQDQAAAGAVRAWDGADVLDDVVEGVRGGA